MNEIMINGSSYPLRFGMGFLREINRHAQQTDAGLKRNVGLRMAIAGLIDGSLEDLHDVIMTANRTETPRLSAAELDAFFEDGGTDIDAVFSEVLDFLKKANVTKKEAATILEAAEKLTEG